MLRSMFLGTAAMLMAPEGVGSGGGTKLPELSAIRAKSIYDAAVTAGEKMSENTLEDVSSFIEDKEAVTRGPVIICNDLMADYGLEAIQNWPEPGSKAGETGNADPDKFTLSVVEQGVTKKRPQSFYSILFDATAKGKAIKLATLAIGYAEKGEANPPEGYDVEAYKAYKRMTAVDRSAERAREAQARTNARNVLVKGVRILKQWAKVEKMEKVGVRWAMKDSGEKHVDGPDKGKPIMVLRNTPKPIVVYNKLETTEASAVSVDTFLSYFVDTAIANGGTLGDLTETASRDTKGTPGTQGAGQIQRITNSSQLEGYLAEVAAYIETDEGKADMLRLASGKNAKAVVTSICIIADRTDSISSKQRHIYEAYLEEKSLKAVKAAA